MCAALVHAAHDRTGSRHDRQSGTAAALHRLRRAHPRAADRHARVRARPSTATGSGTSRQDDDGVEWIGLERRAHARRRAWPAPRASPTRRSTRSATASSATARPARRGGPRRCASPTWTRTASTLSVLYPTTMLGLQSMTDVEFGRVQARAYNDWCADAPGGGRRPPLRRRRAAADAPSRRRAGRGRRDPPRGRAAGDGVGLHAPEPRDRVALLQRPGLRPHLVGAAGHRAARRVPPVPRARPARRVRGPQARPAPRPRRQLPAARGVRGGSSGGEDGAWRHEHLLHAGDRQPRRRDERDLLHHLGRRRASGSRARSSCSSRRTAAGWCRGSSGSTTTPRSSAGTCRG